MLIYGNYCNFYNKISNHPIMRYLILIFTLLFLFACKSEKQEDLTKEIYKIENGLTGSILVKGDSVQHYNITERMRHYKVPGVSVAVVREGTIRWAKGYGIANTNSGAEVNVSTLFQAGSISKPVAALSALQLVQEGKINLDDNVNEYLTSWKIPDSEFLENEKVTLRRLLTHTAGMTVHGFPGYSQTDSFPTINEVLDGKGNTPKIFVDTIPGSFWRYSGGGYTVMEKLVEDVSGLPLEKYMESNILKPLGMSNSTYEQPLSESYHSSISAAYDMEGNIVDGLWHNYPEKSAAGLWTTPTDLAKYCIAIQQILSGKENSVISKETAELMITKHKNDWGLGPALQWDADSLIFRHGGKNVGFTNNLIAFAYKGDALIIMTNADNGGKLINEIERSVSDYYDWNINNPRIVETIDLTEEELTEFVGKYKLNYQIPGIGDYFIQVMMKDGRLLVNDPNNNEVNLLEPLEKLKFIDLESGQSFLFQNEEGISGCLIANSYQFNKVGD